MKSSIERHELEGYMERQLSVQKRNLFHVCRCAIKSLIDRSCFDEIDDNSEELINFCSIMEEILNHRLKAAFNWRNPLEDRYFWDYVKVACRDVPNNCLRNIERMENIKSSKAKGRAWLRLVLMEKRMSEYISTALKQTQLTRDMYMDGAMMVSNEVYMLCDAMLGLNAIDFTLCLKGEHLDIGKRPAIDYSPFLTFKQSREGDHSDEIELNELQGYEALEMDDDSWKAKFFKLEAIYKTSCKQKGYLEELVRIRESQYADITQQRENAIVKLARVELEAESERNELQGVVLELQQQLSSLKEEHQSFQKRVEDYFRHHRVSSQSQDSDWLSIASSELQHLDSSGKAVADTKSIYSSTSEASLSLKEQTPSLATLRGSVVSQTSQYSSDFHEIHETSESCDDLTTDPLEKLENRVLEPPRPRKESKNDEVQTPQDMDVAPSHENVTAGSVDERRESPDNDFEMVPNEGGEMADKLSWDNFPLDSTGSGTTSEEDLLNAHADIASGTVGGDNEDGAPGSLDVVDSQNKDNVKDDDMEEPIDDERKEDQQ